MMSDGEGGRGRVRAGAGVPRCCPRGEHPGIGSGPRPHRHGLLQPQQSLLSHYAARIPALEHRYLNALTLLNRIDCEFVFVCSQAPSPEVVSAYLDLVPPEVAPRMRERTHCTVEDSPRSLAAKLLDRPDLLDELRHIVAGRTAVIEPWNVTADEVRVAVELGVAVNGTAPHLRPEAFKGAGRRLFRRTGVPVPLGREDVRSVDDVVAAVEWIRRSSPGVSVVVVKHDDSGAGDGNAVLRLRTATDEPIGVDEVRVAVEALPD